MNIGTKKNRIESKLIFFAFLQRNLLKMNTHKKSKIKIEIVSQKGLSSTSEILRSIISTIKKQSTLEGDLDFFHPSPQLDQNFKTHKKVVRKTFIIYSGTVRTAEICRHKCTRPSHFS